uniref:Ribosome associated membrane protein RAMP4 n=1 Tax=Trypanosoma vivax (strain Y486) TaxID=1055687 RepID=G0U9N8_TRYVY|nr:conserved hypothetical protein [Trypanosoma vivax Y486]
MPLSPVRSMRIKAQKQNSLINNPRLSDEEKRRIRERRENVSPVPAWMAAAMLFLVFGSILVQIYFTVKTSPKMGQE